MGSQVVLDLIASSLTYGTLLLMAIRLNGTVQESVQMYNGDVLVQSDLITVIQMIEYDFRKIGYCADPVNSRTRRSILFMPIRTA